jgi:Fe-S-cluster containining protein
MSFVVEIGLEEPKFICTGCGKCCYGGIGAIILWNEKERYEKAFPDVQLEELVPGIAWTLPKNEKDGCIHLKENGIHCELHGSDMKPQLCKGWPRSPRSNRQAECLGLWVL